MNGNAKIGRLAITRLEDFEMGEFGIWLSNGNFIAMDMEHIFALPGFDALKENERFFCPLKTEDGSAIYWRDGSRQIGVEEILALVGSTN